MRFFVRISRVPIDINRRSAPYTRYTSSLWHAIQALAECLITCMSHHSSINHIDPLRCARSFPFASTSEIPKRHSLIGLGRVLPCSQCHPNWPCRDHVGHCGPGYMVPSAAKFNLQIIRHNLWYSLHPGEWFFRCATTSSGVGRCRQCLRGCYRVGDCGNTYSHQPTLISE